MTILATRRQPEIYGPVLTVCDHVGMFGKPAVYLIEHTASGRVYVGSAGNLSKRWSRHRAELRSGTHRNTHLQAAWNRYGEQAFRWRALAIVEKAELVPLEQRAIDYCQATDPGHGFNKAPTAGISYGGGSRERTPEWLAAMSRGRTAAWETDPRRRKPGSECPAGHIIDGSQTRRRKLAGGRVAVVYRCQDCTRLDSQRRARERLGIPPDWPLNKHFNRRGRKP